MGIFLCLVLLALTWTIESLEYNPLSDEYIEQINIQQSKWKAGRNFNKNTPLSEISMLMGAVKNPTGFLNKKMHIIDQNTNISDTFDAREHWPECANIKEIQDQSACGSDWAIAAASAMSDRICIHSDATRQISVSAEDLVTCCDICGDGCAGGDSSIAWLYWTSTGIVSGGAYGTAEGCKAYSMPPCEHHNAVGELPACGGSYNATNCTARCDDGSNLVYENDTLFGEECYFLDNDAEQIQWEIFKNGPVGATFTVFDDFPSYKSGVYEATSNYTIGEHAVRILGWGTENDLDYWLVANSWNEDWGDKGLFKILRGTNHCGIESEVTAGIPEL